MESQSSRSRRSLRRAVVSVFAVASVVATSASAPAASGSLDGKTFAGETGEVGKAKGESEEITFKDGTFHSKGCDAWGFGPAPYTTVARGSSTTFEATTKSPKEGTIVWKGVVSGQGLKGTFRWSKPGQKDIEYWVRGTLKR